MESFTFLLTLEFWSPSMPKKQVMLLDHRTALAKIDKDSDKAAHIRGHMPVLEGNVQICLTYRTADPLTVPSENSERKALIAFVSSIKSGR